MSVQFLSRSFVVAVQRSLEMRVHCVPRGSGVTALDRLNDSRVFPKLSAPKAPHFSPAPHSRANAPCASASVTGKPTDADIDAIVSAVERIVAAAANQVATPHPL